MTTALLTFDVDGEAPILAAGAEHAQNAMAMTHQAFGPRVGVPRILRLLAEYGLPATFFVPGLTAERHPHAVEAILEAGHEVAHHSYAHVSPVDLTPAEQRRDFERGLEALAALGVQPTGHRAAMWEPTWVTLELVAEYGLRYDSSLMDDDRPYILTTSAGTIAELPPHWALDDWEQYAFLPRPAIGATINRPGAVADMWIEELDGARRHGATFLLTCHPFLSGRAARVEALRRLIETALDRGDVEFLSGAALADRTLAGATPARVLTPTQPLR